MKAQIFCSYCGVLCTSEEKEVTRNLFDKNRYHINMTCWSCKKILPEITIDLEEAEG
jgi:hypothetical protein